MVKMIKTTHRLCRGVIRNNPGCFFTDCFVPCYDVTTPHSSPKAFTAVVFFFLLALPLPAQHVDSLYAIFSASRGQTRISAANEIIQHVYENEYFFPLITLKTDDEETLINATVFDAIGGYFEYEKGNYKKSIEFYKLALDNYEKMGNVEVVNLQNSQIGANYARTSDYENAVAYMMKCYEWGKRTGDDEGLSNTLNNLGVVYSQ